MSKTGMFTIFTKRRMCVHTCMWKPIAWGIAAAVAVVTCCPPKPAGQELFQALCDASASSSPRILFADSKELTNLEATAQKHAVAVRYAPCELEVLPACNVPGTYEYAPVSVGTEQISISDETELALKLPLSFAALRGKIAGGSEVNIEQREVGRYGLWETRWSRDELKGSCDEATHIVTHFSVGAYHADVSEHQEIGAGAEARGAGAEASRRVDANRSVSRATLNACESTSDSNMPPDLCKTPLSLHVVEIEPPSPPALQPDAIVGLWKGTGQSTTTDGMNLNWDVTVRILNAARGKCAEVVYSGQLDCSGFWTCEEPLQGNTVIDFTESLRNGSGGSCTTNATGRLVAKSPNLVSISYYGEIHDRATAYRFVEPAPAVPGAIPVTEPPPVPPPGTTGTARAASTAAPPPTASPPIPIDE